MIKKVKKITPSKDMELAWLAGIVDGEGSIGIYSTARLNKKGEKRKIFNLSVVNTDIQILNNIEIILKKYNIFYSKFKHNYNYKDKSFISRKPCYVIAVRRIKDFEIIIKLLYPFLKGYKQNNIKKSLLFLENNRPNIKKNIICQYCGCAIIGRKRKYCTLKCWHKFAKGKNNPNYRTGRHIMCND